MNNDVELISVKGVSPTVQTQSDNVIYVPQAHKNKAGIVKEGDGVLIENGVVSLNKQTVEDMIDANKWVSYGFKQNLTEDEKGMARHNIGAGDNDFTGSYYDVTQKPHLNTDNSVSLPVGDEEINNIVILHKISKTGSFNNLNDVPHETLDFAESERQKSKNLLNLTRPAITSNVKAYNDHIIIINGTVEGYVYPYFSSNLPQGVQLKQGNTYTFSRTLLRGTGNNSFKIDVSLRNINDTEIQVVTIPDGEDSVTFTIESNDIAMYACSLLFTSSATFTDAYYGLQIEEGSVATDYQPYNGAIVHEKEIADVEHIELLYDKTSSNANINKGLTSGLQFDESGTKSVSLETSSTSKYKGLNVYVYAVNQTLKVYLPVDKASTETACRTSFAGQNGAVSDSNLLYGSLRYRYGNLYPTSIRDRTLSSENIYQNNSSYYVSKVEGVY